MHAGISKTAPTGLQDAITPPFSTKFAFSMYAYLILVFGYAFYANGLVTGVVSIVVFFVFVLLNRLFFIPKPQSEHFRNLIISSMIKRHADYLKNRDNVRAGVMAEFLEGVGIPATELANHFANK